MSSLLSALASKARRQLEEPDSRLERVIDEVIDFQVEVSETLPENEAELRTRLGHQLSAYGELQPLLNDPSIEEVWINSNREVFIARNGKTDCLRVEIETNVLSTLVEKMLRHTGRRLDRSSPFVDAWLPDGSRLHAVIPDITREFWSLNIRKFPTSVRTLNDLVQLGAVTSFERDFLSNAIKLGKNLLISGATQAGKTTLLCALLQEVALSERIISVEETFEIKIDARDWVAMQTRQPNLEGVGEVSLRRLVKESLRMRPGRIVVGEVREAESFDLLIALNSGLPGLCTIHANSAADAVTKLCTLPLLAGSNIRSDFVNPTVGNCIDLVVHVQMNADGHRSIREIKEIYWNSKRKAIELQDIEL